MLSFEERLELFKKELAETSPEDTLAELRSYEAKGPLASSFLEDIEEIVEYNQMCSANHLPLETETVKVTSSSKEWEFSDDAYTESLAMAA